MKTRSLISKKARRARVLVDQEATDIYDTAAKQVGRGKKAMQRAAAGVADAFSAGRHVLAG
jgi:hypothetical protein